MPHYSLRIALVRASTDSVSAEIDELALHSEMPLRLVLASGQESENLREAQEWVLKCSGWESEDDALQEAGMYEDALRRGLARVRIGVDFGYRQLGGWISPRLLNEVGSEAEHPVIPWSPGPLVFPTAAPPLVARIRSGRATRCVSTSEFTDALNLALANLRRLTDRERLSSELFFSSFFAASEFARFLFLVMAVEASVEREPIEGGALRHVDQLVRITEECNRLDHGDRDRLLNRLRDLRKCSIRQACLRIIEERLADKQYEGLRASRFFDRCYKVRSRMVHGEVPEPTIEEIREHVASLECFVSDLLTWDLPNVLDSGSS